MYRQIPSIDFPCYSPYINRYPPTTQPLNTIVNPVNLNPACPVNLCPPCAGPNCNCNLSNINRPFLKPYFVYRENARPS